ncbi:Fimbria adhesin protein precursor [Enterobacter sp. DC4]|uniref:fimbrial protein n=1 Tax=Enterobacter sp. DC4 TaxID=1395580 RepID=UPI0003ED0071|nr:fimbrial protein [Enterobacter sp. DC4]EWG65691.1 Fimbria adhesin protein precursor [Enterobacter sp. DC4]
MILRNTFIVTLLLSGTAFTFAPSAHADCSITASSTISVPNLIVQRDAPVGSQIGSEIIGSDRQFSSCSTGVTNPSWGWGIKSYGTYVMTINGRRVYSTNIAGIGYAIGMESTLSCSGAISYVTESNNQNMICGSSAAGMFTTFVMKGKPRLTFYKTAQTTGSGMVNSTNVGASILNDWGTWRSDSVLSMNSFNVTTTACSVTNAAVKVPLGNVLSTAFTGTGSTAAEKNFTIDLDCDASTRVNLTLEGAQDSSGAAGVLALTQATTGATASGVGVQVLYNDTPVTFGSMFNVGTATTKGAYAIPLTARYYQTTEKVTGGQANSLATFTITYQ